VTVDLDDHLLALATELIQLPSTDAPRTIRATARVQMVSKSGAVQTVAIDMTATDPAVDAAREAAAQVEAIQAATYAAEQVARRAGIEDAELIDDVITTGPRHATRFDTTSVDRAMSMIEAANPWNAFELPQPALPPGPSAYGPSPDQLPPIAYAPSPDQLPPIAYAPSLEEPAPTEYSSNVASAAVTFEIPLQSAPVSPAPFTGEPTFVAPTTVTAGGAPLARRVPGATTRDELTIPVPQQKRPQLDADEARELIEQFEFGVAQALRDADDIPVPTLSRGAGEGEPGGTEE
jgi:hypothetical protein